MRAQLLAVLLLTSLVAMSAAQAQSVRLDVPAQDLGLALEAFAAQADKEVLFDMEQVRGKQSVAVKGDFDPSNALKQMIGASGLRVRQVNQRTFVVGGARTISQAPAPARVSSSDEPEPEQLEEVIVRGKDLRGVDVASSATGLTVSLRDTPQSVKVISADLIELVGLNEVEDISRLDASVTSGGQSRRDRTLELVIRGFEVDFTNGILMDGFRLLSRGMPDFSNVERMEVVKGPVSSMYGQASLAGTVNLISKKPLAQARHSVKLEGGDWDYGRVDFDSTGPAFGSERLRYRATGAVENRGSFIDRVESDKQVIAPAFAYDFTERTTLLVQSSLLEESLTSYRGQPVTSDGRLVDVPRGFFFGQDWNRFERRMHWLNGVLTHQLANGWQLGLNAQYNRARNQGVAAHAGYFPTLPDGTTTLSSGAYLEDFAMRSMQATLSGTFHAWSREHSVFIGVDRYSWNYGFRARSNFPAPNGEQFNIFSPDYELLPPEPSDPRVPVNADSYLYGLSNRQQNTGVTVQTKLQAAARLSLLMGMRVDDSRLRTDGIDTGLGSRQFVPQVGVVYELTPGVNAYVNYGETFLPQPGRQFDGDNVGPERGEQFEAGIKGQWLASRIGYSLAYFDMTRDGLAAEDPEHPGYSVRLGEQRSTGIEFDLSGRLLPGWDVYASAAWLDAKFVQGVYEGLQAANTPRRALSLFSTYQVQDGWWRNVGIGVGVTHKSGIAALGFGAFPQTRLDQVSEYTVVDLRLFYQAESERWEVYASAQNLLDEVYYFDSGGLGTRIQPAEPRRIYGGVKFNF
ncbi:TonB-dependent siderophore receptor [Steroidobacter sp.]|uniref:TonB-dependent siderophore receptor n=1 Tax=Steroidobacter sp. TaxID=1978227 RepID=UPI001A4C9946|nr:TonB-dependent receptor [Steroidobacter sp.]MBL8267896.1 TonB-dependent receptor [Steroidobacter sp.]